MEVMAGFKHTELGIIPNEWSLIPLEKIADPAKKWSFTGGPFGSNLKSSDYTQDGVRVIQLQNIGDGVFHNESEIYTSHEKANELLSCNIYPNEIILSKMGDPVARASIIPNFHDRYLMCSDGIRLSVNPKEHNNYFIFLSLNFNYFRKQAESASTGSTRKRIGLSELRQLNVICPKVDEQNEIAKALRDADALIESLEKLIVKKRQIKQGTMQELLTGKKRLVGFSGEWEEKPLGFFLQYEQPTKYLVKSTDYNQNSGTPVLTAGKTFILGYIHEDFGIYQNELPVIIFDDFTTSCQFVDFPFKAKSSAMKILKKQFANINIKLLFEILKRMDYSVSDHKRHWIGEFQNLKVKIPDFDEQNAIAKILDDMDSELSNLEAKLSKARQIKQGMMQELLTGRIRLV